MEIYIVNFVISFILLTMGLIIREGKHYEWFSFSLTDHSKEIIKKKEMFKKSGDIFGIGAYIISGVAFILGLISFKESLSYEFIQAVYITLIILLCLFTQKEVSKNLSFSKYEIIFAIIVYIGCISYAWYLFLF